MVAPALPVPLSLKMIREPSANISRKPWKKISKGFFPANAERETADWQTGGVHVETQPYPLGD